LNIGATLRVARFFVGTGHCPVLFFESFVEAEFDSTLPPVTTFFTFLIDNQAICLFIVITIKAISGQRDAG
jgi:hypothetical protein